MLDLTTYPVPLADTTIECTGSEKQQEVPALRNLIPDDVIKFPGRYALYIIENVDPVITQSLVKGERKKAGYLAAIRQEDRGSCI
jgi:hypothetical protein